MVEEPESNPVLTESQPHIFFPSPLFQLFSLFFCHLSHCYSTRRAVCSLHSSRTSSLSFHSSRMRSAPLTALMAHCGFATLFIFSIFTIFVAFVLSEWFFPSHSTPQRWSNIFSFFRHHERQSQSLVAALAVSAVPPHSPATHHSTARSLSVAVLHLVVAYGITVITLQLQLGLR